MKKTNVPDRIGDWRREVALKQEMYNDYLTALTYHDSHLLLGDLNNFYKGIVLLSRKSKKVSLDDLRKKFKKYNDAEIQELIKRLKMLGEIYDPYFTGKKNKNEEKCISLI